MLARQMTAVLKRMHGGEEVTLRSLQWRFGGRLRPERLWVRNAFQRQVRTMLVFLKSVDMARHLLIHTSTSGHIWIIAFATLLPKPQVSYRIHLRFSAPTLCFLNKSRIP